jgi:tripeptide aminopeptidase
MKSLKERAVKEFVKMVQIDSLSLKEEKMFLYLRKRLSGLPVKTKFLPYTLPELNAKSGNLVVKLSANSRNKRAIFFDAHIDTVEPGIGIRPVIKGNRVESDGKTILGADDKAGAAAMVIALEEIINEKLPHGDIYFLFTSAEEIGLTGVRHLDLSGIKTDYGFILDSHGKVGGVITAAPYHYQYDITVRGKASHAGIAPENGISAIKAASRIVLSLPQGKISKNTVANVGMIDGGSATNVVPEECRIKGEFRSHRMEELEALKLKIKSIVEKNKKLARKIDCVIHEEYKGFSYQKEDAIIKLVKSAIREIGLKPRLEKTGGGSNTNIYNQKGVTSLTLAVGMANPHSTNEMIEIDDLENLTKLILKIIEIA